MQNILWNNYAFLNSITTYYFSIKYIRQYGREKRALCLGDLLSSQEQQKNNECADISV